jgi:hypothetical protein
MSPNNINQGSQGQKYKSKEAGKRNIKQRSREKKYKTTKPWTEI